MLIQFELTVHGGIAQVLILFLFICIHVCMQELDEFEKQLQTVRPKLWEYRTFGRSLGLMLFLGGAGGMCSALWYLDKPAQVVGKFFSIGGESRSFLH